MGNSTRSGEYWVNISIGDAGFASTYTINAEGINYWNNQSLVANQFLQKPMLVAVNDGYLTTVIRYEKNSH